MPQLRELPGRAAEVLAVAAPFWAGEAEVVHAYFSRSRTVADHLHWLRAQAYKEARLWRERSPWRAPRRRRHVRAGHPAGGDGAPPPSDADASRRFAQEKHHFTMLAELVASHGGSAITPSDAVALPQDRRLQHLRTELRRQGGALERAVVDFTEGGGGAMYWALSRLAGDAFTRRVATVFAVIYRDEIEHGPAQLVAIARCAERADDWQRAKDIVRGLSLQRLRMRNEMFGHPLGPVRMRQIGRGEIEPWVLHHAP